MGVKFSLIKVNQTFPSLKWKKCGKNNKTEQFIKLVRAKHRLHRS